MAQPIPVMTTPTLPAGDSTDDTYSDYIIGISVFLVAGCVAVSVLIGALIYCCYIKWVSSSRVRSKNTKSAVKKTVGQKSEQQQSPSGEGGREERLHECTTPAN